MSLLGFLPKVRGHLRECDCFLLKGHTAQSSLMGRRLSHSHTDGTPLTCSFSIYSSPSPRTHTVRAELRTEDGPELLAIQARVSTVFPSGSITLATLWLLLFPGYLDVGGSCTASYPVCHRFSCSGPAELHTACVSVTNHRNQQISAQTYRCLFLLLTTYQDDSV